MITLVVCGRKGGVGKTTICASIGAILAVRGKRVLLVDTDPQSNAAFVVGADPAAPGSAELLVDQQVAPQATSVANLYVLAGGPQLDSHDVRRLDSDELSLAIKKFATEFDGILIDAPPGFETTERLALRAAAMCVVVIDSHPLALMGAARVFAEILQARKKGKPAPERIVVVQNKYDGRRILDRQIRATIAEHYPTLRRFIIRQNARLAQSMAYSEPITHPTDASSENALADLMPLIHWIVEEGGAKHESKPRPVRQRV